MDVSSRCSGVGSNLVFVCHAAALLPTNSLQPVPVSLAAPPATALTSQQTLNGQCAVTFAPAQQCGGNMTNVLTSCSDFNSCSNTLWAGGCCPPQTACTPVEPSGGVCWSCGGGQPETLLQLSQAATESPEPLCVGRGVNGDYDYGCVLGASMMFYEAQRSGRLPANNRIPWRGNSALLDEAPNGASIVGGW